MVEFLRSVTWAQDEADNQLNAFVMYFPYGKVPLFDTQHSDTAKQPMAIKKSELYSSLWQSCDELRGGMDASQYKDYVLVLLFVKYVSRRSPPQSMARWTASVRA